jgi:outer membrane protein assembly factor BamB
MRDIARAPAPDAAVPVPPAELWSKDVGRAAAGPVAVGDSVVVTTTADKRLTVMRRDNGQIVWQRRLHGPGAGGPLFTRERVFAGSADLEGRFESVDLLTGKRRWRRTVGPVVGPIALRDSTVFAATAAGVLFALGARHGEVHWQRHFPAGLHSGATVIDNRVFVATDDSLYLVDAGTGAAVAAAAAVGAVRSAPAVSGNVLVITSPAGAIAGYDPQTLTTRWSVDVGSPLFGGAAIARDTAFAVTVDGDLWRIPLHSPDAGWAQHLRRPMRTTPAPVRDGVLLGTVDGALMLVGADTDTPLWSIALDGPLEFPPVVDRGVMLLMDGRGTVYAWETGGSGAGEP